MFQFEFSSGNSLKIILWPFLLLLVGGCTISIIIRRIQLKNAVTNFKAGNTDSKFITTCQNLKHVLWSKQSQHVYDMLCCMLSAVQLDQGNENSFFQNLNSLKSFSPQTEAMVYLLFVQYFSGCAYMEIHETYRQQMRDSTEPQAAIREIIKSKPEIRDSFDKKKESFANTLTQLHVTNAFSAFSDMLSE